MAISIKCPKCNAGLRVPDEAPGRKVRCAQCQTVFVVPQPEAAPAPSASPAPAAAAAPPASPVASASGAVREPDHIRNAADYRVGEKVVLTLPLRASTGEIPVGVTAVVMERSSNPKDNWLRLGVVGFERVGDSFKTAPFKVESLEHGEGQRFLTSKNHGNVPMRKVPEGWYVPEGGTPVFRANLRDGRHLVGALYERTTAPGSFNLVTKLHLGRRWSDESGTISWKGTEFQADDIVELIWMTREPIPEEIPETAPAREPWQRFEKYVKIAKGLHDTAVRPNMRFQFVFKDKTDADRVLGMLPSEFLGALRRGECWMRSTNAQGKYQLAWNGVQLSIAQGKDLMNRVVKAGGEIFEAILE